MPSLWRKVIRSKQDHETQTRSTRSPQPQPRKGTYLHDDLAVSTENRLHYLQSGQAMRLLRQVHLIDPVQSPSWSGVQRSTQESPSILYNINEEEEAKLSDLSELLQPGIVELTSDPNMLSIRGLLLDTIKHVGNVVEHGNSSEQSYKPPKWLTKLAITNNSAALREVPLNIAANPLRKSKTNPLAALQEKYDDFMAFVFGLMNSGRNSAQNQKYKKSFENVKMCVTELGYFGLVPPSTKIGDYIFMVERDTTKSIFVIRKHTVHGFYIWNGLVYMQDVAQLVDNKYATDRILVG